MRTKLSAAPCSEPRLTGNLLIGQTESIIKLFPLYLINSQATLFKIRSWESAEIIYQEHTLPTEKFQLIINFILTNFPAVIQIIANIFAGTSNNVNIAVDLRERNGIKVAII